MLKHLVLAAALLLAAVGASAQNISSTPEASTAYAFPTDPLPHVPAGVMDAQVINRPMPVYPLEARNAALEGQVVMYAVITAQGTVESLSIYNSEGLNIFRRPTLDAVNKWTFKPYLVNGQPTTVGTFITVTFKLS